MHGDYIVVEEIHNMIGGGIVEGMEVGGGVKKL